MSSSPNASAGDHAVAPAVAGILAVCVRILAPSSFDAGDPASLVAVEMGSTRTPSDDKGTIGRSVPHLPTTR
jgi:hypothetical protein